MDRPRMQRQSSGFMNRQLVCILQYCMVIMLIKKLSKFTVLSKKLCCLLYFEWTYSTDLACLLLKVLHLYIIIFVTTPSCSTGKNKFVI